MQPELRKIRKEYKAVHGHFPNDYRSKIECVICQTKSLVEHAIITRNAGGDAIAMIQETSYSDEVKALAIQNLKEIDANLELFSKMVGD